MKRYILLFICLIYSAVNVYAQDLIVTNEQDSINCKIADIKGGEINYRLKTKNAWLSLTKVKMCQWNYYNSAEKKTSVYVSLNDVLITSNNDSLICNATNIKNNNIYFQYKDVDNKLVGGWLPLEKIKYYQSNYYSDFEKLERTAVQSVDFTRFRLAINGGYSYRIGADPADLSANDVDYTDKLRSGFVYGADATFYFAKHIGVGLNWYGINYSNSQPPSLNSDFESDDINVNYMGLVFSSRFWGSDKRNVFFANAGVGYMLFKDVGRGYRYMEVIEQRSIEDYEITAGTVGFFLSAGYDFEFVKSFSLGIQTSLIIGSLNTGRVFLPERLMGLGHSKDFNLTNSYLEKLTRIDVTIGLRFNK